MRARKSHDLEKFFSDLDQWDRVVVKNAQCSPDDGSDPSPEAHPIAERRQTFIRVGCDLDSAEPKSDAELA